MSILLYCQILQHVGVWNDFSIILRKITMNNKPIQVRCAELQDFVAFKSACVIQATIGVKTEFNQTLLASLQTYLQYPFSIGSVDIEQINYLDPFVQTLIREQMTSIGLMAPETLLPGYYLFKKGTLAAYHPGTFDVSRLDDNVLKNTMKIAAGISIIAALLLKSASSGLEMFAKFSEVPTGMSIFEFFKGVVEAKNDVDVLRKQQTIFRSEIEKAYALLEVLSTVNDDEVKAAYKKKLKECHPDMNPGNKEAFTKLTVKVIEAFELIKAERKSTKVEV